MSVGMKKDQQTVENTVRNRDLAREVHFPRAPQMLLIKVIFVFNQI
jgi:hypothetical protein